MERARREALDHRREWEQECAGLADEIEGYRSYENPRDEFIERLESELAELQANKPPVPELLPPPPPS